MIALMVRMQMKPEHRDAFLAALLGDARGSAYDEPGCLRFDVVQDASDPHVVYLYEVYRDEAALEAHRQAPHYRQWREAAKEWFASETVVHRCVTVFPSDSAWEAVKPRV